MHPTSWHTARLTLRPLTASDLDDLVALDGDPEVMRYLTGGRPTPPEAVRDEQLPRLLRTFACLGGRPGMWAAEVRHGGGFLGWFEFRPVRPEDHRVVELGYRLRRAAWGRGYATEGARALVEFGFRRLGVERVVAETMTVNSRSRRVMERAGLRFVRTYVGDWPEPVPGAEHGDVEYALTRAEWSRVRTPATD